MQLPESTLDSRLADAVIELMQAELGHALTGGVLPLDDARGIDQSGIKTPTLRVLIQAPRDDYDTYDHETRLLLLLVTKRALPTDTGQWLRHRLAWAVKRLLRRHFEDLVDHESHYQYALIDCEEGPAYFFEPGRAFLATPIRATVTTHQLEITLETEP